MVRSWNTWSAGIPFALLSTWAFACSPYDPELIAPRSTREGEAQAGGRGGSTGGDGGAGSDAGSDAGSAGGGGGGGASGSGPEASCGDAEVSLTEKCDIAIPEGEPGACPTECPPLIDCVTRRLEGSNCQAECVLLQQRCTSDDGCCPSGCTDATDSDCSASCGDGIVDTEEGELCEPEAAEGGPVCPTDCDDGDPCTEDVLAGSSKNCTAVCTHAPITALTPDDQCCPPGANANTDPDCTPMCGNDVREAGEECDGGLGCQDCELSLTPEQMTCIDDLAGEDDLCTVCSCTQCAPETLACKASDDPSRDMHCTAVIDCANEANCAGPVCYCGADNTSCLRPAEGPCRAEIEAAAGTSISTTILLLGNDPNSVLGRANALGACVRNNCLAECR